MDKAKSDELIKDILAKKELSNLNPEFVLPKVEDFLRRHKKIKDKLEASDYSKFCRSQEHKEILKHVRASLREVYGVFIKDGYGKRHALLEELKEDPSLENHEKILKLHKSTEERLSIYPLVYKKIFAVTGMPKKIADLACGLNPLSYPYLECRPEYIACDISAKDLEFIGEYFKAMKIKGGVKRMDLVKDSAAEMTKDADVTFLFKALDSLEVAEWNRSEEVLKKIKSRYVVVSFATRSIGGRKEIRPERRAWVERIFERNGWEYTEFELPGEYFYVVTLER